MKSGAYILHLHSLLRLHLLVGILGLFFVIPSMGFAQTTITHVQAAGIFSRANAFYQSQKYQKAADTYSDLVHSGIQSASLYYNLGTSEARLGHQGAALAYLQKARSLAPRDPDIQANLEKAKADNSGGPPPNSGFFEKIIQYLTVDEWLWLAWGILMASAFFFFLRRLVRRSGIGWFLEAAAAIFMALFLVVLAPACTSAWRTWGIRRVIVVSDSVLKSGPGEERFNQLASVPAGTIMNRLSYQENGYQQVEASDGTTGYISQAHLIDY